MGICILIAHANDFQQAGGRYCPLGKVDQEHLIDKIVDSLGKADKPIQSRMVENLASLKLILAEELEKD